MQLMWTGSGLKRFICLSFADLYPMEKDLRKKSILLVDFDISVFNKQLTVSIEDVPFFKDAVEGCFEAQFKAFFALAGPTLQPIFAAIAIQCPMLDLKSLKDFFLFPNSGWNLRSVTASLRRGAFLALVDKYKMPISIFPLL